MCVNRLTAERLEDRILSGGRAVWRKLVNGSITIQPANFPGCLPAATTGVLGGQIRMTLVCHDDVNAAGMSAAPTVSHLSIFVPLS